MIIPIQLLYFLYVESTYIKSKPIVRDDNIKIDILPKVRTVIFYSNSIKTAFMVLITLFMKKYTTNNCKYIN